MTIADYHSARIALELNDYQTKPVPIHEQRFTNFVRLSSQLQITETSEVGKMLILNSSCSLYYNKIESFNFNIGLNN